LNRLLAQSGKILSHGVEHAHEALVLFGIGVRVDAAVERHPEARPQRQAEAQRARQSSPS